MIDSVPSRHLVYSTIKVSESIRKQRLLENVIAVMRIFHAGTHDILLTQKQTGKTFLHTKVEFPSKNLAMTAEMGKITLKMIYRVSKS